MDILWMNGYKLMDKSVSRLMGLNVSGFNLDFMYFGYFCNLTKFI